MASRSRIFRRSSVSAMARHVAQINGMIAAENEKGSGVSIEQLAEILARDGLPGTWRGRGATVLGLGDVVRIEDVVAVMRDGLLKKPNPTDPFGDDLEISLRKKDSENGFHGVILALPKTISLLLASQDEVERQAAEAAAETAQKVFLEILEALVRTRTGAGGVNSIKGDGLIAASFTHRGSSSGDPHLHIHLMIANSTRGADEIWRTIDSRLFIAAQRLATAAAMRAAQAEVSARLGLGPEAWIDKAVGSVTTPELVDLASASEKLSRASERLWKRRVKDGLGRTVDSKLDHYLWTLDRQENVGNYEKIEAEVDLALAEDAEGAEQLRADWRALGGEALEAGFAGLRARRGEARAPARSRPAKHQREKFDPNEAFDFIHRLEVFSLADLAAWMVGQGVSAEESLIEAAKFLDDAARDGLVHMGTRLTPTIKALGEGLVVETRKAHAAAGIGGKIITDRRAQAEARIGAEFEQLARSFGQSLLVEIPESATPEQALAIQLAAQGRRMATIRGVAGTGKSFVLKPIAEAAHRQGLEVVAIARNSKTGRDLGAEIGADFSSSVAAFLARHRFLAKSGVPLKQTLLVVDEGGVLDEDDLLAALRLAADPRNGIQVILSGDRLQAQSIDKRATWAVLAKAAERAGAAAELTTSWRNRAWAKEAGALRVGNVMEVVAAAARGQRLVSASSDDFALVAARLWEQHPGSLVVTFTNQEAASISQEIQKLRGIEPLLDIGRDQKVGVGDLIRTRKNDHERGVFNGDTWQVARLTEDGCVFAENAAGRIVVLQPDYLENVELAYCGTIDALQGVTAARSILVGRAGLGRNLLYSGATRGRQPPLYLMVDDQEAPESVLAAILSTDDTVRTAGERVEEIAAKAEELKKPHQLGSEREQVEKNQAARIGEIVKLFEAAKAAGGADISSVRQAVGVMRRTAGRIYQLERDWVERRQNRENRRFDLHREAEAHRAALYEVEERLDRLTKAIATASRPLPDTATLADRQTRAQRVAALEALQAEQRALYGRVAERWSGIETNLENALNGLDQADASDRHWMEDYLGRLKADAATAEAVIQDFLNRQAGVQTPRPKAASGGFGVT